MYLRLKKSKVCIFSWFVHYTRNKFHAQITDDDWNVLNSKFFHMIVRTIAEKFGTPTFQLCPQLLQLSYEKQMGI